jgi:hypothetical protein
MNAELYLLGRRIDMAPRVRRRWLVVLIYASLAALMAGFWFLDHWRESLLYLYMAAMVVNSVFLGGTAFGGLIRPFKNKPRSPYAFKSPLLQNLRWGFYPVPDPDEYDYRNDERELRQRDRAHYQAYRVLIVGLALLWAASIGVISKPAPPVWAPMHAQLLLYGFVVALLVVSLTLPQAILLWSEPDMEEETAE